MKQSVRAIKPRGSSEMGMRTKQSDRKFSWPLTLLTAALVTLMGGLGFWQLDRAGEKQRRLDAFDAGVAVTDPSYDALTERYGEVVVTGRYDRSRQIIMDGFSVDKRAGYQVLTPFIVQNSDTVLMVNRGWRVWSGDRNDIQGLDVDGETVEIRGRAERFWAPGMVLGDGNAGEEARWPRIVVYPQHNEISAWMQQPVAVWQLLLDPGEANGFLREWSPGGLPPERHVGYAVQWFALALTLIVLYLVLTIKRYRSSEETE